MDFLKCRWLPKILQRLGTSPEWPPADRMLNRSAVSITAKQPFLDWLRRLPDPVDESTALDGINESPNLYLLPQYSYISEQDGILEEYHDIIFEKELNGWWTDPSDWPVNRTYSMFKEWFEVIFHSMIEDLDHGDLI